MKNFLSITIITILSFIPLQVNAELLLDSDITSYSILSGGYATYGTESIIRGDIGATSYITVNISSATGEQHINNNSVISAISAIANVKSAYDNMDITHDLPTNILGITRLEQGVYSGSALTTGASTSLILDGKGQDNPHWIFNISTYLSTGASTQVSIINAGKNASVIWNIGSYASLGAETEFMGAIISNGYVTGGANTTFTCGNILSKSYVSLGASAIMSSKECMATETWEGSINGMGGDLIIVNGIASTPESSVSVNESSTYIILSIGFILLFYRRFSA
jgi:hypothetical protein